MVIDGKEKKVVVALTLSCHVHRNSALKGKHRAVELATTINCL